MRNSILLLPLLLTSAACGGTSPGTGSKTLYVEAEAHLGAGGATWMAVSVREGSSGGSLVSNAVVRMRNAEGDELGLPWEGVQIGDWRAGSYQARDMAWSPAWRIIVERGEDELVANLEVPGATVITRPTASAQVPSSETLVVAWSDESEHRADQVRVELRRSDFDRLLTEDRGSLEIPASALEAANDEVLTVTRTNEVNLAGGTAGSYFRATTAARREFAVVP